MSRLRMGAAVFGGLLLGQCLFALWLARQPTPASALILALIAGPAAQGLTWKVRRRAELRRPLERHPDDAGRAFTVWWRRRALRSALGLAMLPVVVVWMTWNLCQAVTEKVIFVGGHEGWASRSHSPISFWMYAGFYSVFAVMIYVMGGRAIVARATRGRGAVDAYLPKGADRDGRISAIPPRPR